MTSIGGERRTEMEGGRGRRGKGETEANRQIDKQIRDGGEKGRRERRYNVEGVERGEGGGETEVNRQREKQGREGGAKYEDRGKIK